MGIPGVRSNDKRLSEFVKEITSSLKQGNKYQTEGLGTFTTCSRKDSNGKSSCTIAMFRPSTLFREYISGGPVPNTFGPHKEIVQILAKALKTEKEITLPSLGSFVVEASKGNKIKISFQGAEELNKSL